MGFQKGTSDMEIISSVENIRGRIRITFESGWKVWLHKNQNPGFPLQAGVTVDRNSFMRYITSRQYPAALNKAVAMLAARACSRKEIESRLLRGKYDQQVIDSVLNKLDQNNLINDMDFSRQWVQSRMKKYGPGKIRQELKRKGVDEDTVQKSLEMCSEENQMVSAVCLASAGIRTQSSPYDRRKLFSKITSMLVRRGYSWDIAVRAFNEAAEKEGI